MIVRRWNDQTHRGRANVYPRAWFDDWFFFFLALWCLVTEAFGGSKSCDRLSLISLLSFSFLFPLLSPFSSPSSPLFLEGLLCYTSHFHWSWPSICWSCRLLLECLSHLLPSSTCYKLQQTRWYCSGVISSLMQPDCWLQAFNVEVTASPEIAPSPCPHSWPTVFVLLFGMPREAVFEGVPLSPFVTLVCRGQDCPRRRLLTAWTFLVHPQTFLLPWRGPWVWYEMGRGCQLLRPYSTFSVKRHIFIQQSHFRLTCTFSFKRHNCSVF